jgi:hypothetical protein
MSALQTFTIRDRVIALAEYDAPAKSSRARALKAPGAGKFSLEASLSRETIAAGDSLALTAHVSGRNMAHLFTEILLRDRQRDQYYGPLARDYVRSPQTRTTGGVTRPVWDSPLDLSLDLRPRLTLLADGTDSTFGFFLPAGYDDSDSHLEGLYTSAAGAASRRARLTVDSDGAAKKMVAFKEGSRAASPSALTLKPGDQFAPFVQVLTRDDGKWQSKLCLASSLTFRGDPFQRVEESLPPGDYLAGLLIQDLDGNFSREYVAFTVKE